MLELLIEIDAYEAKMTLNKIDRRFLASHTPNGPICLIAVYGGDISRRR